MTAHKLEFNGRVNEHGTLHIVHRAKFDEGLKMFAGKDVELTVQNKRKSRSIQQNRWLWCCFGILSEHLGYSKQEIHDIVCFKFLKRQIVDEKTGDTFDYLKGTSGLTTTEFSTLMEELIQWSAEQFAVVLPLPNEQLTII